MTVIECNGGRKKLPNLNLNLNLECNARSYPESYVSSKITLLANHQAMSSRTGTLQQLTKYLDMELSEGDDDCLPFSQCKTPSD